MLSGCAVVSGCKAVIAVADVLTWNFHSPVMASLAAQWQGSKANWCSKALRLPCFQRHAVTHKSCCTTHVGHVVQPCAIVQRSVANFSHCSAHLAALLLVLLLQEGGALHQLHPTSSLDDNSCRTGSRAGRQAGTLTSLNADGLWCGVTCSTAQ